MKLHARTQHVNKVSANIRVQVLDYASSHGLTPIELLQALTTIQQGVLKQMLREERHPDDPDRKADEA